MSHREKQNGDLPAANGTPPENSGAGPIAKPSDTIESAQLGQSEQYPRARDDERTEDELNESRNQAWKMWDV